MTGAMFWAFEIFINFYEGFIYTLFLFSVLDPPEKKLWPFTLSWMFLGFGYTVALIFDWSLIDTWVFVFPLAITLCCFKNKPIVIIFWNIILVVVVNGGVGLCFFIAEKLFGLNMSLLLEENTERIIFVIIANLFLTLSLYIVSRQNKGNIQNISFLGVLLLINILDICIIDGMFGIKESYQISTAWVFFIAALALSASVLSVVMLRLIQRYERNEAVEKARLQRKILEENRVQEINNVYSEMRKMKHDLKGQLAIVSALYESGEVQEGKKYLHELEGNLSTLILTGSPALDAELSIKRSQAEKEKIQIDFSVSNFLEDMFPVSEFCSVIGNMLDNAIESIVRENLAEKERKIRLAISCQHGMMMTECSNPIVDESLKKSGEILLSVKKDPGHGIGTRIIKEFAEKNKGSCVFKIKEHRFIARIIVPLRRGK